MLDLLSLLSLLSNILGVLGALFALLAWLQSRRTQRGMDAERERQDERIEVVLVLAHDERRKELPVALRRRELTRAELLGRLGMLSMVEPGRRFSLAWLATPAFLARLDAAQQGRGKTTIAIPCSAAEFEQFA